MALLPGDLAPDFTLDSVLDGKVEKVILIEFILVRLTDLLLQVTLSSMRGQFVVLMFYPVDFGIQQLLIPHRLGCRIRHSHRVLRPRAAPVLLLLPLLHHLGRLHRAHLQPDQSSVCAQVLWLHSGSRMCSLVVGHVCQYVFNFTWSGQRPASTRCRSDWPRIPWVSSPTLHSSLIPLLGDVAKQYGVYKDEENLRWVITLGFISVLVLSSFRALFVIDPEGEIVTIEKCDLPVGCSMTEQLRQVQAAMGVEEVDTQSGVSQLMSQPSTKPPRSIKSSLGSSWEPLEIFAKPPSSVESTSGSLTKSSVKSPRSFKSTSSPSKVTVEASNKSSAAST